MVQCGTNDIIARGLPAGDAVANTVAVWDKILEQGKPVIAILIPPRFGVGDGSPYSAAKNSNILEFNTRCTAEAAQRKGVYIVNVWPKSVDLTSVNAVVKPGHTKDGLHPDGPMAQDMGEQVAIILRALAPINRQISAVGAGGYYHPLNNRGGNLLPPNLGGFAGIGGALGAGCVVGTGLADGYQLARRTGAALTCMPNKIVDPDGGPDWQELVFTGAAVDGENFWLLPNLMNAANLANFADGDIISSELEFKIFGAGCTGLYGEMLLTGGNLTNWEALQLRNIRNGIRLQHGVMRWEPLKWRAGVTAIQPRLWVVSKQGASFKVWLRNFAMVKKIA